MKIVINYQEYADVEAEKKVLKGLGEVEIIESKTRDPAEFMREAADADAALVQYVPVNADVIKAMKSCKVIVRYGIAYDNIDVVAARAAGITVCHVPSYCISEVSNHALALILALHRKLFVADRAMRDGSYALEKIRPIARLAKCRAGLVGLGRIAQELAGKLRPLVGEVWAYDPFVDKSMFGQAGAREKKLDQIFAECDIISIHVPVNKKTRHLVNKEMIGKMKRTAYLVNTSRGAVIDEAALAEALATGKIGGAGLDVFEAEPLSPDSPLQKLDNVVLTGHYAWYSEGAIKELKETAAMEAVRVLKGEAPAIPSASCEQSMDLFDLSGKKALVTGGSYGLGKAMAEALLDAGAAVGLVDVSNDLAKAVSELLAKSGQERRVAGISADLLDRAGRRRAFDEFIASFGTIDILVNNAGIQRRHRAEEFPIEDWDQVIELNLTAVFDLCQLAGRVMLAKGSGKIINVASLLSFTGGLNVPAYAAAKGGVAQLTKALANEWAARDINVNALAPGYMDTPLNTALVNDPVRSRQILDRIPAGRWGLPSDLKGAIVFLASPASDYIHGTVLAVDGGFLGR